MHSHFLKYRTFKFPHFHKLDNEQFPHFHKLRTVFSVAIASPVSFLGTNATFSASADQDRKAVNLRLEAAEVRRRALNAIVASKILASNIARIGHPVKDRTVIPAPCTLRQQIAVLVRRQPRIRRKHVEAALRNSVAALETAVRRDKRRLIRRAVPHEMTLTARSPLASAVVNPPAPLPVIVQFTSSLTMSQHWKPESSLFAMRQL